MKILKKSYLGFILILSHAVLLVVLLNFFACLWIEKHQDEQDFSQIYRIFNYKALNSELASCQLDSSELVLMFENFVELKKSETPEFLYHPATEYQLNQFSIPGVTIIEHESGFNIRTNGLDSDKTSNKQLIFCFGGSTTYGSFAKDEQTWPAFLEAGLDSIDVVNFGVPGFVPTQETAQFIHLMKLGYRPDLVIFMDGVNIGPPYDASDFTRIIAQKFNENKDADLLGSLAIVQLLKGNYKEEIDFFQTENVDFIPLETTSEYNDMIRNRFVENAKIRKQIAALYGVKILQFIQPNGNLNYPVSFCNDFGKEYFQKEGTQNVSKNLGLIFDQVNLAEVGYVDLTNLFQVYNKPALIDLIHYTPEFNQFIANEVKSHLRFDEIKTDTLEYQNATGIVFALLD